MSDAELDDEKRDEFPAARHLPHCANRLDAGRFAADEVQRQMRGHLTLVDADREVSQASIERWWQRTLAVAQSLRERGLMTPNGTRQHLRWSFTNPAGVRWANEVAGLQSCPLPAAAP